MVTHWVWLTQRKGIGYVGCQKLLAAFGSAENIYKQDMEQYRTVKGFRKSWGESLMDKDLTQAEKVVDDCNRLSIRIITYDDPAYPERLKQIYDPPCVLYCKGELPDIDREPVVSVVGTRMCSNYGIIIAKQLATLIAISGGVVVSGGARGIDTVALNSAFFSETPMICVLAGGLDTCYPPENRALFERVTQQGCLLSEAPPGVKPFPTDFIARNRLISGISIATLVVEAPKGSGALTTAEFALSQNRDVFTVYRPDGGRFLEGNEELINAGCEVIQDGWELLERYVPQFPDRLVDGRTSEGADRLYRKRYGDGYDRYSPVYSYNKGPRRSRRATPIAEPKIPVAPAQQKVEPLAEDLPETEGRVLSAIGRSPIEIDAIIAKTGMEPTVVSTALTMLQIKKRIIKCYGNSYQRL